MVTCMLSHFRQKQRGQTLPLVALGLGTLIAMAALAIDVTTLYVARGQMQRAADAAALAGAKAFVDSGATTAPTDFNLRSQATTLATNYVNAVLAKNLVGGVQPTLVGGITPDFTTHLGNPQLTITLQRTNLPTFFSRIFGRTAATVSATATAEAYNSSLPPGSRATNMPPVAPSCVKPWLVANIDPDDHGAGANQPFIKPDGSITSPAAWTGTSGGVVGEQITLNNLFTGGTLPGVLANPGYLLANIAAPSGTSCPSCAAGSNFSESVACCDTANASLYQCGLTTPILTLNVLTDVGDALSGAACLLTGATGTPPSIGVDTLNPAPFWTSNGVDPMEITAGSGPHNGQFVNTSNQIVTLPIINVNLLGTNATVIGYMQAFVSQTTATGMTATVLNISGCGTNVNTGATPVTGGGSSSPVPVRLINQ